MTFTPQAAEIRCPHGCAIAGATMTQGQRTPDGPRKPLTISLSPCGHEVTGEAAERIRDTFKAFGGLVTEVQVDLYGDEFNWSADQSTWPAHLRDDAPTQRCGRCGRQTVDTAQFGTEDRMTQPDGYPCGGRFEARS